MPKRSATPATKLKTVTDNRGGHRSSQILARQAKHYSAEASIITVRVPLSTQQRGTRKLVISPWGHPDWAPEPTRIDDTLIGAIARAYRWNRMLESGGYASISELASAEGITESYLCRILRLTLLAPKIIEAILDGRRNVVVPQLQKLIRPFPAEWNKQESLLLGMARPSTAFT